MEKNETPEWLRKGAYAAYSASEERHYYFKVASVFIILTGFALYFLGFAIFTKTDSIKLTLLFAVIAIAFLVILALIVLLYLVPKYCKYKFGNSKEWQDKYLKSAPGEYKIFESASEAEIQSIRNFVETRIEEIRNNITKMQKKEAEIVSYCENQMN